MAPVAQRIFDHLRTAEAATLSLASGEPVTDGYAYCPDTEPLVAVDTLTADAVRRAVWLAKDCTHLGTWRHPNGRLVFLRTVVVDSADEAQRACQATGQLAFYDLGAGREIPVGS